MTTPPIIKCGEPHPRIEGLRCDKPKGHDQGHIARPDRWHSFLWGHPLRIVDV